MFYIIKRWGEEQMTKIESKVIDFMRKNIIFIVLIFVTVFAIIMRMTGLDFESGDYKDFLLPWYNMIAPRGIGSMATQIGNYNIPYQFYIAICTDLPISPLYAYKLLSIVFDFVLALSSALLVYELTGKKSLVKPAIAYSVILCSINVIFNSSFWGQCDSIYVAFIILSIYFLIKHKNIASFVMLGIAFSFKLQTVFILPFFLLYYFMTKKCSILHFLIVPATDFLMCIPALIFGRNIKDLISIYVTQTDYGKQIQMNCPNIYSIMCEKTSAENYYLLKPFAIMLTFSVLLIVFAVLIRKGIDLANHKTMLMTALWSVWTCLMFLPSMHERYPYLLDIIAIILALVSYKYIWTAVLCNLCSLRGYCFYLFKFDGCDARFVAIAYIVAYAYFTYLLLKDSVYMKKSSLDKKLDVEVTNTDSLAVNLK